MSFSDRPKHFGLAFVMMLVCTSMRAQTDEATLQDVVVTGTRNETDVRHLPMTVTVIAPTMEQAEALLRLTENVFRGANQLAARSGDGIREIARPK